LRLCCAKVAKIHIYLYEIAAAEKHPRNAINTKTRYYLLDEDAWTVENNPDMGVCFGKIFLYSKVYDFIS
jgi:hypothetical protein